MSKYTAKIVYDEKTVLKLDSVITSMYNMKRRLVPLALCVILILCGIYAGFNTAKGVICILMGAFLFPIATKSESSQARQILQVMKGRVLTMEYSFEKDKFICKTLNGETECGYNTIIRLVEDNDYMYLFQKTTQACMIDKKTLTPATPTAFKRELSEATGMKWERPKSLMSLKLGS